MTYTFPQEIIDFFIAGLAECHAHESLVACTLVSHSFSHPARRRLFAKIRLVSPPSDSDSDKRSKKKTGRRICDLCRLIAFPNSDFASLIRTLHIEIGETLRSPNNAHGIRSVLDTWISLRLPRNRLETLSITAQSVGSFLWKKMGSKTSQCFLSLLDHSPNLVNLHFSNITNLPLSLITQCTRLQSLELYRTTIFVPRATASNFGQVIKPSSSHLEYLCIHRHINGIIAQYPDLLIQSISRFKVSVFNQKDALSAWKIINQSSGYLRCLDLCVLSPSRSWASPNDIFHSMLSMNERFLSESLIDIGALPYLHTLNLHIETGKHCDIPPLDEIFTVLDPHTHPTSIQTLKVFFNYTTSLLLPAALLNLADKSWRVLHPNQLRDKHPGIRSVSIDMDLRVKPQRSDRRLLSDIETELKDQIWLTILSSPDPLPSPVLQSCAFVINVTVRS